MPDFSGMGLRALMMEVIAIQQENKENPTVVLALENIYQALGFCLHTKEYCEKQIREAQATNAHLKGEVHQLQKEVNELTKTNQELLDRIELWKTCK